MIKAAVAHQRTTTVVAGQFGLIQTGKIQIERCIKLMKNFFQKIKNVYIKCKDPDHEVLPEDITKLSDGCYGYTCPTCSYVTSFKIKNHIKVW